MAVTRGTRTLLKKRRQGESWDCAHSYATTITMKATTNMLRPEKTDCSCSKSPLANAHVQGGSLFMTWHAEAQSTR